MINLFTNIYIGGKVKILGQGCKKFHSPPPLGGKEIKDPRGGEGKEKGKRKEKGKKGDEKKRKKGGGLPLPKVLNKFPFCAIYAF